MSRISAFLRQEYYVPDVSRAGLITLALIVPLVISHVLGNTGAGIFVAITAQLVTSAKLDGTYPERALILLVATLALAGAAFAGTLAGASALTAVGFIGVVAGLASFARGIGDYGQLFGISAVILFLISLHAPHTLEAGLLRGTLVLAGGAWASVLVLCRWPFRPNLPFYLALARPWYYSSRLMEGVARELAAGPGQEAALYEDEGNARKALNEVLPWLRKKRKATAHLRRDALKLARASSRFGATALSLHAEIVAATGRGHSLRSLPLVRAAALALTAAAKAVTGATVRPSRLRYSQAEAAVESAGRALVPLSEGVAALPADSPDRLTGFHLTALLEASLRYLEDALLMLRRMEANREKPPPPLHRSLAARLERRWRSVRMQLQPGSLLLQHSLRVSLVTALGSALYYLFDIPRGYWIVLTVMILLQPEFGSTWEKTRDRLLGTLAGAGLGTVLLMTSSTLPFAFLAACIAGCCFLFAYYQPKNYKLAVVFVTVMLVSMLEISEHIDWHIALYRMLSTTIGGVLAVGAAFLLWPRWESVQFPQLMAKALQADRAYLQQIGHELASQAGFHQRVIAARRKAEVRHLNARESIKRLDLERGWHRDPSRNAQQLVERAGRLTRELTALAAFLPRLRTHDLPPETFALIDACAGVLDRLSAAVAAGEPFTGLLPFAPLLQGMAARLEAAGLGNTAAPAAPPPADLLSHELLYSHFKSITDEITAMTGE
ncbi:MAG: FUSC family protein [Cytophagales bacterium]|nr:FUSC family protein [Cytophagales bacterium]